MKIHKNLAFNLFDLLLVLCLLIFIAAGYRLVTAEYRLATPAAADDSIRWARITLTIPSELQWLCAMAASQPEEIDPRSGAVLARVMGCTGAPDAQEIEVHVRALADDEGRVIFRNRLLVPGLELRIETDRAVFEGVVHDVALIRNAAPAS